VHGADDGGALGVLRNPLVSETGRWPRAAAVHRLPDLMERPLVGRSLPPLRLRDRRLEVVVVDFVGEGRDDLNPGVLRHENAEAVVGFDRVEDFAPGEEGREAGLQGLEVPRTRARTIIRLGSGGWPCRPSPSRAQTALNSR
jgi:hypothetical protein